MIYGYIRVSTDKQTVENQRYEINNFCQKENIVIERWIEETISGTKEVEKRQLGKLMKKLKKGDVLICSELSRLGRTLLMIMSILHFCMKEEVQVWTIKDNFRLGKDIQSQVLAFAFGLAAEIERNLISQRTKEALARKRTEGVVLGRPIGGKNQKTKLSDSEKKITEYLKAGVSFSAIARILKVNRVTVSNYAKKHNIEPKIVQKRSQCNHLRERYESNLVPDMSLEKFVEMYIDCKYSLTAMAKYLQVSTTSLRTYAERKKYIEAVSAVGVEQRAANNRNKQ